MQRIDHALGIGPFPFGGKREIIVAQMLGAAAGAFTVWLFYRDHFNRTVDDGAQLACFSTEPAIRNLPQNFISEMIGTFVLIFVILYMAEPSLTLGETDQAKLGLGTLGALPVALLVTAIGLSLGGTTGYAINPARDLGPRIMHWLLPMNHKGKSGWTYSWVPVLGPFAGAFLASLLYLIHQLLFR